MVEASFQMCICEILVGVLLATQMDATTGALSRGATIGLIVVVSTLNQQHTAVQPHKCSTCWLQPHRQHRFKHARQ
jgi:hypothetical protein